MASPKPHSLIGQTFGEWIVEERLPNSKYGKTMWQCLCKSCGNKYSVSGTSLVRGKTKICHGCSNQSRTIQYYGIPNRFWSSVIGSARHRNIELLITREQAYELLVKQEFKCSLTGISIVMPETNQDIVNGNCTASIDRIDSSLPYTLDNIQWVHKNINYMKGNLLQKEFIELCRLVVEKNK
jgi:hypothetical protein